MSRDSDRRRDSRWLEEQDQRRAAMTRGERMAEAEQNKSLIANIKALAAREGRDLTNREEDALRRAANLIGSIEKGLETEH